MKLNSPTANSLPTQYKVVLSFWKAVSSVMHNKRNFYISNNNFCLYLWNSVLSSCIIHGCETSICFISTQRVTHYSLFMKHTCFTAAQLSLTLSILQRVLIINSYFLVHWDLIETRMVQCFLTASLLCEKRKSRSWLFAFYWIDTYLLVTSWNQWIILYY